MQNYNMTIKTIYKNSVSCFNESDLQDFCYNALTVDDTNLCYFQNNTLQDPNSLIDVSKGDITLIDAVDCSRQRLSDFVSDVKHVNITLTLDQNDFSKSFAELLKNNFRAHIEKSDELRSEFVFQRENNENEQYQAENQDYGVASDSTNEENDVSFDSLQTNAYTPVTTNEDHSQTNQNSDNKKNASTFFELTIKAEGKVFPYQVNATSINLEDLINNLVQEQKISPDFLKTGQIKVDDTYIVDRQANNIMKGVKTVEFINDKNQEFDIDPFNLFDPEKQPIITESSTPDQDRVSNIMQLCIMMNIPMNTNMANYVDEFFGEKFDIYINESLATIEKKKELEKKT